MFKLYKNLYNYLRVMDKEISIKLTSQQKKIFGMLKKYKKQIGLQTVMRVAGGWVRDKVLGSESKDIDIALDDMKGQQFVNLLIKHAKQKGQQIISGFGVTKFNPDQSKHLETATAKVYNHWIDFVNLRSQKYNQDSRIPVIQIGTPLQDAQRRDFTINTMFYNLDTQSIEDWIGKGLPDLENKIIRTPLQPYVTFKDDPLRILRCLRFQSRLGFKVDEKIYQAIKHPQIKQALLKKVSKQRIGIELVGLLKAKQYLLGLEDIRKYELWNIVFHIPEQSDLYQKKQIIKQIPDLSFNYTRSFINSLAQNVWKTQKDMISTQVEQEDRPKLKSKKNTKLTYEQKELQFLILISSLTFIYRNYFVKNGKTKQNLLEYMVKNQLKYSAKHARFATHFAESVDKLAEIKSNESLYAIIRWLRFAEQKWQLAIHFLHAYWSIQKYESHINLFQLREDIIKKNLTNCYLTESPVDGTFLTKKGIKGPVISKILQNATIWRITNPDKPNEQFSKEFQQNAQFFMSETTYK